MVYLNVPLIHSFINTFVHPQASTECLGIGLDIGDIVIQPPSHLNEVLVILLFS